MVAPSEVIDDTMCPEQDATPTPDPDYLGRVPFLHGAPFHQSTREEMLLDAERNMPELVSFSIIFTPCDA